MNNLSINLADAVIGAHYNNYYHDKDSRGELDSPDDQFSIKCGYKWADEHSSWSSIRYTLRNSSADKDFEWGTKVSKRLFTK